MSQQANKQALGTLIWVVVGLAAVGFIFWDSSQVKKQKKLELTEKLLFQLKAFKIHDTKHGSKKKHKHKHALDQLVAKDRKEIIRDVNELRLTSPKSKKELVLVRTKYRYWEFKKPFRTPANSKTVDGILQDVLQSKSKRKVLSWKDKPKAKTLKKYGLLNPKHKLTLVYKKKTFTVHIGNKDPFSGNYFARVLGRKSIITAGYTVFNSTDKKFFDLRLKHVFTQQTRRIQLLSLTRKNDQVVFELKKVPGPGKRKRLQWFLVQPIQAKGSKNNINTLLSSLRHLKANQFVSENGRDAKEKKKYGLDKPDVIVDVILKGKKKKKMTLYVARKGGKTYVTAASGGPISRVGNYILKDLTKPVTEFREKSIAVFKANFVHIAKISVTNRVVQGDNKIESTENFDLVKLPRNTGAIWKVKPEKGADSNTKKGKAMDFLRKLRRLQIQKFVNEKADAAALAKAGLDKPHRTYQIFGLTRRALLTTVYIGNKDASGTYYYATDQSRRRIYALKVSDVDKLLTAAWQVAKDGKPPKRRKPVVRKPDVRKATTVAPKPRTVQPRPAPASRPAARPAAPRKAPAARVQAPTSRPAARTAPSSRPAK